MYKVAAYITVYEDYLAANKCLAGLNNQSYPIEKVFIIDNSREQLDLITQLPNLLIQHHPKNIGVAGGLKVSIQWALDNDYDFLWTFDQDSEPLHDTLVKLITAYKEITEQGLSIGIIAPAIIHSETNRKLQNSIFDKYKLRFFLSDQPQAKNYFKFYNDYLYECDVVITSGSLINLKAAKNIPLPNEELFIDAVDWDYCFKMKAAGFHVFVVDNAIINHRLGEYNTLRFNAKLQKVPVYNYSAIRYYYMMRNHTFIESRLAYQDKHLWLSIAFRFKALLKKIIKIILYEDDNKIIKLWACLKGTFDGFIGKLGKTW